MHVGKVTGCYAGYIHWQRCPTRGESQGMYITYTSAKFEYGRTHSGFETQRRCHKKSKTGVSVAPKMDMCPTKILKKIKEFATIKEVITKILIIIVYSCFPYNTSFLHVSLQLPDWVSPRVFFHKGRE